MPLALIARIGLAAVPRLTSLARVALPAAGRVGMQALKGAQSLGRLGGKAIKGLGSFAARRMFGSRQTGEQVLEGDENNSGQHLLADTGQESAATSTRNQVAISIKQPPGKLAQYSRQNNGNQQYVTYGALYKILEELSKQFKSFVDNSFSVLLPPLEKLEQSSANLAANFKALVDRVVQTQKREEGAAKEQLTERRNQQLRETDKQLLDRIRGKAPQTTGLIGNMITGIFVATSLFGDKLDDIFSNLGKMLGDWTTSAVKTLTEKFFPDLTVNDAEKAANKAYSVLNLYRQETTRDPVVLKRLEADYLEKQAAADEGNGKTERARNRKLLAQKLRQEIGEQPPENQVSDQTKAASPSLSEFKKTALDPFYNKVQVEPTEPPSSTPSLSEFKKTALDPFYNKVQVEPTEPPSSTPSLSEFKKTALDPFYNRLEVAPSTSGQKVSMGTEQAKQAIKKEPAPGRVAPLPPKAAFNPSSSSPHARHTNFGVPSLTPREPFSEVTFNV